MKRFARALVSLFLLAAVAAGAGEAAIDTSAADRDRLGRSLYRHDFENRRDPDSGVLLPESADIDGGGWPDFWEPVRAVGFPEYLINDVAVVTDTSGQLPGAYRDVDNHVLRMRFDGTRVGVRTRVPVPVDPSLAYEFSLRHRDADLAGARIRAGVEWIRFDPAATRVLRSDEVTDIDTGQVDWPVAPARMVVDSPPPEANAARLFVMLERDPDSIGGAYHGILWIDDVVLRPLPRIVVDPPRPGPGGEGGRIIQVRYSGLEDNIPDPANPGFFRGRRYNRRVEVTDVFGRPVDPGLAARRAVEADDDGFAAEELLFPRDRYGVFYFNIRLYDADDRLATDVMRAVAVMKRRTGREGLGIRAGKPLFGVLTGVVPDRVLGAPGMLAGLLTGSGARVTKVAPWRDSYAQPGQNNDYYTLLADQVRGLRAEGIGLTGVIRPPRAMFGSGGLADVVAGDAERMAGLLSEAGRHLGLFMDGWQWGDDGDASLAAQRGMDGLAGLETALESFASGLPQTVNRRLGEPGEAVRGMEPSVTNAFVPLSGTVGRLWPDAAPVFPWLFEPYYERRGAMYPPDRLADLAPPPPVDLVERQARDNRRTAAWLSLELTPTHPHEPNAAIERVQLEQMMTRAVYAAALQPEAVFLGDLFDARRGMLRRTAAGDTLETIARPTYLAAGMVAEMLEGADYLGELGLLPPFEAHVFRRPGADAAVIVLWHNDSVDERALPRAEIANGPPLQLVDWAGNAQPLPSAIPATRVPSFITGLSASLALTRMSVRIGPEPRLFAATRAQGQTLEVVNHMTTQAPLTFRLRYAARPGDGVMENGWSVGPEELRANLSPRDPLLTPARLRFRASPDPNSPMQIASPAGADKSGLKVAQVTMSVHTSPPADILLHVPFRLQSEIDVDVEPLPRVDDPHFVTLQLKLRWFPDAAVRRRSEIRVTPYFQKHGQMREPSPFPVAVKALPSELRGNPGAPFESAELRIPRRPAARTWVGLTEDGGSGFYLIDVTEYMTAQ